MIRRIFGVSLVLVLVVIVVANLTVARLPEMPPADGEFITLRGKEIHYVEQDGEGIPVVMIHGLPGTHKDFDPVVEQLPHSRLFALDRPGFGWSDGGWLPFQDQIDVVHEFLTELDISPAVVVGHSYGGAVALGLARRYPQDVAKMVLLAPAAGGIRSGTADLAQARYVQFSQMPVVKSVVSHTFGNLALRSSAHFGVRDAFAPGDVDPGYRSRLLAVTLTPGNLTAYADEELEVDQTIRWVDDNVVDIEVGSVQIAATGDRLVPIEHARRLAATLSNSELIIVEGSHMIMYTHPDVVAEQIRRATSRP